MCNPNGALPVHSQIDPRLPLLWADVPTMEPEFASGHSEEEGKVHPSAGPPPPADAGGVTGPLTSVPLAASSSHSPA